jgi:prephenate dehydratase
VFPELHPPYHYHLQIFDRWGIEIYKAYDQAWDGGQFPDGSYYFFIEMEACGQKEQAHGVLRIIH